MVRGRCCGNSVWHGKFRGCGYRLTNGREIILNVLLKNLGHLSAEDVYLKVREVSPTVGLTTVYRTLEVLSDLGMVTKLDFGEGRARYEISQTPQGGNNHHHHLVCTQCNKIIDYTDFIKEEVELLKQTEEGLSKKYSFKITNHVIQFYGLCSGCSKK